MKNKIKINNFNLAPKKKNRQNSKNVVWGGEDGWSGGLTGGVENRRIGIL